MSRKKAKLDPKTPIETTSGLPDAFFDETPKFAPSRRHEKVMQRATQHIAMMIGHREVVVGVVPGLPEAVLYISEEDIRRLSEGRMGEPFSQDEENGQFALWISDPITTETEPDAQG